MQNILNHFIESYRALIEWWVENPQSKPVLLELKHGSWIYQIEIRWLVKYFCLPDLDATMLPTPEIIEDKIERFGKKLDMVIFTHDKKAGEHDRISKRFVEYDKVQTTLDLIRPHLRKVDFEITWGKTRVSSHQD